MKTLQSRVYPNSIQTTHFRWDPMAQQEPSYWLMKSEPNVYGIEHLKEEKPLTNKEEKKEKDENSLLNYEYDEDDDGVDWET